MSTADILTGQFVRIRQTPASVADRIVAVIIDDSIIAVYAIALFLILTSYLSDGPLYPILLTIAYLPALLYHFICETLNNGQSIGKRLRHIRVVKADGSQPSIGALFMRWMTRLIDVGFYCIGLVFILLTKHHQRIGDMAAGTMVISLDGYQDLHITLDDFNYARRDYRPQYNEAQSLSIGQVTVIEKALESGNTNREEQIDLLARKVQRLLNIQPRESSGELFLTTILHDYQYFATELI